MKRMRKRVAGVVVGLVLGWMAQGYLFEFFAAPAAQASPATAVAHADQAAPGHTEFHTNFAGAENLVPHQNGHAWFVGLSAAIASLFVLAIVVGVPASKFADSPAASNEHDEHEAKPLHRHSAPH